jgi:hypothetical protein
MIVYSELLDILLRLAGGGGGLETSTATSTPMMKVRIMGDWRGENEQ